jgi:hypothetical protein
VNGNAGYAIFAVLLGVALFGYMRAQSIVEERWRIGRGPLLLGAASIFAVVLLAALLARSLIVAVALALILATLLWTGYRWRRSHTS